MEDFEQIVRKLQKPIYYFCFRILRNHPDSDEAMQKTFMKAYENIEKFRNESSLKTWIYKIALNVCRNEIRGRKPTIELSDYHQDQSSTDSLDKTIRKEQHQAIEKAIKLLPSKQREVIVLRINEERSFSEIARIMSINENSAKVNFHHGITRIKKIIENRTEQKQ